MIRNLPFWLYAKPQALGLRSGFHQNACRLPSKLEPVGCKMNHASSLMEWRPGIRVLFREWRRIDSGNIMLEGFPRAHILSRPHLGLVTASSSPSRHTLEVISQYAAEMPYHDLLKKVSPVKRDCIYPDRWGLDLLQLCLEDHHFDTVIKYLKRLPTEGETTYELRMEIPEVLGNFIRQDRKAQKYLLPELAKFPQGRFYFFETFVDIDFLHVYYADALDDYLKYTNKAGNGYKDRDIRFALNLQFRRDLFHGTKRAAIKTAYRIKQLKLMDVDLENFLFWFPIARTFFTDLMTEGALRRDGNLQPLITSLHDHCAINPSGDAKGYALSESLQALYFLKQYAAIREIGLEYLSAIPSFSRHGSFYPPLVMILKEVDRHFGESNFAALNPNHSSSRYTSGTESYCAKNFSGHS